MRLPILLAAALAASLHAEPPKAMQPGVTIELVASDPDVRTPTAIATDARGRVWVLENNTHFRPAKYDGAPTDRVLIMDDFGPDGRARKITTFADGFSDGMGLLLLPGGDVIVSTRAATLRLHDKDGDGRADERRTLLTLVTDDKYPHNGLTGIARSADGALWLGFGENHGFAWTLTGSDGKVLRGTDEGGVFRFDDEGRGLVHWAWGVWNLYGLAFDPMGRLFATDNDPGSGSYCRLLHIVKNGDYGYRYRYGRTIDHPFTSWDGRWPGMLPPVSYIGEAPTGLLWHGGALLGCTWTDHGIQRFPLKARGASFTTKPQWLIRGGHDFRPSGIAAAPDGTLVVSDWVDGSYNVHGKGRVWRVRGVKAEAAQMPRTEAEEKLRSLFDGKATAGDALDLLRSDDPFLLRAAVLNLEKKGSLPAVHSGDADPKVRLGMLLTLRQRKVIAPLADALKDPEPAVRRAALQWIAEERLTDFAGKLDTAIAANPTRTVFEAYIAASEILASAKMDADGKPAAAAHHKRAAEIAFDTKRDPALRALALRLLPVNHPTLTADALRPLSAGGDMSLRIEAVRIFAARGDVISQDQLRKLASDPATPPVILADAVSGLAFSNIAPDTRQILNAAFANGDPATKREAARSLGDRPADTEATPGDPIAGRRVFFRPGTVSCAGCHTIEGRGRAIGPDLTGVWRMNAAQLLESIREPSKEIAPAFTQWRVKMRDGREGTGIDQLVDNKNEFTLLDATGKLTKYRFDDALIREPLPVSLMPPSLAEQLTAQELADLLAYLGESRE